MNCITRLSELKCITRLSELKIILLNLSRSVTIGYHSAFGIFLTGQKYVIILSCASLLALTTR